MAGYDINASLSGASGARSGQSPIGDVIIYGGDGGNLAAVPWYVWLIGAAAIVGVLWLFNRKGR